MIVTLKIMLCLAFSKLPLIVKKKTLPCQVLVTKASSDFDFNFVKEHSEA